MKQCPNKFGSDTAQGRGKAGQPMSDATCWVKLYSVGTSPRVTSSSNCRSSQYLKWSSWWTWCALSSLEMNRLLVHFRIPGDQPPIKVSIEDSVRLKLTVIFLSVRNSIKIGINEGLIPIFIIFLTDLVGSVREKADAQSTEEQMTAFIPGWSRRYFTLSIRQTIMCSVPITFLPANWCNKRQ